MALLDRFRKKKKEVPTQGRDPDSKDVGKKSAEKRANLEVSKKKTTSGAYRVIKNPHITEKAGFLSEKNKYVFRVFPRANKSEVKKTIESLYGVKVEKVHVIHSAPKKRRLGRTQGFRRGLKTGFKKAIVTLKQGDKIELTPR